MTYPTIMPALTLDFQNSQKLDPKVAFSRSSSATYINSAGYVADANSDVSRFEFDSNGNCLGLLIEESRTNEVLYSEDLSNAYWDKQNCSLGATTTAPDGTNSAYLVIPDSANTTNHRVKIGVSGLSQGRSQSCFAKAGGYNYATFKTQNVDCVFDLSTGTANNNNGKMIPYPNGWYRCIFNGSTFLGSNMGWGVGVNSDGGGAGNGTDGVYLWGLQWEDDKSFETSYITTSGSTVTRAADIAQLSTANVYGNEFTIINKPFGVSSGGPTLYLQGYPYIQRAVVYDGYLSQEQINTVTKEEDDNFWRWRVLGSSWEINPTMSGDVTVDWGDGTIEPLQGARINHTFTNGGGYHEVGFRLDSGDWFSVNLNYTGAAEREKAVAVGPMPVGMATTGYYSYNYASNIKAWDAYLIHTYGGPNPHQLGRTYAGLSSLGSFPFTILDSRITSLSQAFKDCTSLQFFPLIDTSSILNFDNAWKNCRSLTSFPLIDTSSGTRFKNTWQSCITLTFFPFIDTSKATELQGAWYGCTGLTSFPLINTSLVENFQQTWYRCPNLTSFPLLDTSSGVNFSYAWSECSNLTSFPLLDTSSSGNFSSAWQGCSGLTSFPLLDTSSGTDFTSTWDQCSNLTSFPLLDTSSGTNFLRTWQYCSNLTSFPLIDTSSGEKLQAAWQGCSNLTSFPAGFFDSWSPSNVSAQCFYNTWNGCTSLTPASVSNILDSLAVAGVAAPTGTGTNDKRITIDWDGTGDPATASAAAITTLQSLNWEIYLNGTLQP